MSRLFQIRVEGVQFSAAHCATIGADCEPLHGHSYEVAAQLDGVLSANAWVVDFVELKAILRSICDDLDHRFLLQRESEFLDIEPLEGAWEVRTQTGRVYVLPASDVVALPMDNTTAERLAQWLCGRLWDALEERGVDNVERVYVEVWEGPGQRASYHRERIRAAGLPQE
jgi:6-pyruvoyltetrahydropterin/6-carboxytetrahydropterin synthase